MDKSKTSQQQKLWSRIQKENVKPKSFGYFACVYLCILLFTLVGLFASIYLANFIGVLQNSHEYLRLLKHGSAGLWLLLPSLPIALIVGFIIFVFVSIGLLRKFFLLYRFSLLRIVGLYFIVITIITFILVRFDTSLNLLRLFGVQSSSLKIFHNHYLMGKQGHIVHGQILKVENNQISLKLKGSQQELSIKITDKTKGIVINPGELPLLVFMLVDYNDLGISALYIDYPQKNN